MPSTPFPPLGVYFQPRLQTTWKPLSLPFCSVLPASRLCVIMGDVYSFTNGPLFDS